MKELLSKEVSFLVGNLDKINVTNTLKPYDILVCEFISEVSKSILNDNEAKLYPDVISLGFWCRKSNIHKLSAEYKNIQNRIGIGIVFHITPTNVPVNFAFSYIFSLLAGNTNIVRVSSRKFEQVAIICRIIREVLNDEKYENILAKSIFIQYQHNDQITKYFSNLSNGRIIWGGDSTIKHLRQFQLPVRGIDIAFADRYSFSIINAKAILSSSELVLQNLVKGFYNDTYLMDQNACSSPRLVVWEGAANTNEIKNAKEIFWNYVSKLAQKDYDLAAVNAIDKFTSFCIDAIEQKDIKEAKRQSNLLYTLKLNKISNTTTNLTGKFGYFYEVETNEIDEIKELINSKVQTVTYFGIEKNKILDFVVNNGLTGIDRIVPIGKALDIGVIWDGYDLIRSLSRIIDVQ